MFDRELRIKVHTGISEEMGIHDVLGRAPDLGLDTERFNFIIDGIYSTINEYNPDVIMIHSEEDLHQDHKILSRASKIAIERYLRDNGRVKTKVIEVLHPSMFNRGDDFLVVELNDDTFTRKKELCSRYTTEKLTPLKQEYFKVYSSEVKKIKRHNLFTESALKDFVLNQSKYQLLKKYFAKQLIFLSFYFFTFSLKGL